MKNANKSALFHVQKATTIGSLEQKLNYLIIPFLWL